MDLLAANEDDLKEAEISDSEDVQGVDDDRTRKRLIDSVLALNNKKARYNQRTVVGKNVSEFNFGAANALSKVHIQDLVQSLKDKTSKKKLAKTLRNIQGKRNVIREPLLKHEKEKIDRATAFTKTCEELSMWDNVVWDNRKKDVLQFPEKNERVEVLDKTSMQKYFKPQNSLEIEVYKLLHGDEHMPTETQPLSKVEQRALKAMDLKKAQIRRSELMKYRALLSYQEIKQRWKNKIKSKRYRRVLKRDKLEKEKSRVNELATDDPEKFLNQMKIVEKSHAKERISLKHRGGSKFQKRQMMYAKYDPNTQQRISDMVKKNRELTKKLPVIAEDNDDDDDEDCRGSDNESDDSLPENTESVSARGSNAWMCATRITVKKLKSTAQSIQNDDNMIVEEAMDEIPKSLRDTAPRSKYAEPLVPTSDISLDPKQILDMSTPIATSIQTNMVEEEDEMEEDKAGESDGNDDKLTLSQAFANDDVIEEFKEEKKAVKERNRPKDIDLTLPGWGSWAGDGLQVSGRKRKQCMKKTPPPPEPQKDDPLGHVIIDETRDTAISKYQVKELPFPYVNAKDFAVSIAAPIGKDWNPQTVVKELIKPKIETKMGTIIRPIARSVLLNQTTAASKNVPKPPTHQKKHKQRRKRQKKK
ncbi:U3 small nucleolar RNA-associated protein 14 homolog A [Octopus sinensis]|uniref:U3 small nucleolar RNA-associated protein 14 homolog A n=1 Tax=Octopus sinensis TaxID=2607531 RepID=A0A6P7TDE9_9MOLL|nr:U3 small nucleolar RNA-associated protein 14 homolog A [Octopus sinensis]